MGNPRHDMIVNFRRHEHAAGAGEFQEFPEFRERFENADMIISKGQGNYESLNETTHNIIFLLMVKCEVIASTIGEEVGTMVVKSGFQESLKSCNTFNSVKMEKVAKG